MGFWSRLFGRSGQDTTVSDFEARVASGGPFRLVVEDVFTITGRGTVITGRVESGSVSVGDVVDVAGPSGLLSAEVTGLEAFRKRLTTAGAGEMIGMLVGIDSSAVARGSVVTRR